MLECPWAPGGHDDTGLDTRCVLKCWWVVFMNIRDFKGYLGMMPSDIAQQAVDYAITAKNEELVSAKGRKDSSPSSAP